MGWIAKWQQRGLRPVRDCMYPYREVVKGGREGPTLARKVRFHLVSIETGEVVGKTFLMQHRVSPQSAEFVSGIGPDRSLMYREALLYRALAAGADLLWTEGEKDADSALNAWNVPAVSHYQGGAGANKDQAAKFANAIRTGSTIGLVMDRDPVGVQVAWHHARLLRDVGIPAIQLVFLAPRMKRPKTDLTDHIAKGYGPDDLQEVSVARMAELIRRYGPLRPGRRLSGSWGSGGAR